MTLDSLIAAYVQFVIMLTRIKSVCVATLPQSYRNEPHISTALEINIFYRNVCILYRKVYKLYLHYICRGFGGAEVACWPLVPKFAGSNPAEAVGFLKGDKKILSIPSFGREVKLSVPCRRFAACKRTLRAYPRHHLATISRP